MKRLPNNFGTISKLSGNRKKPFVVYEPIRNVGGKPKRPIVGYYETHADALNALYDWNRSGNNKSDISTFGDVYDKWISSDRFATLSKSTRCSYAVAYGHLSELKDKSLKKINTIDYQKIIDYESANGMSESSINNIIVVCASVEKTGIRLGLISKESVKYIERPRFARKTEKKPFTDQQILRIKNDADSGSEIAQLIMIMIFTGFRIGEITSFTQDNYDPVSKVFTGGIKTENGINRKVPAHSLIDPYLPNFESNDGLMFKHSVDALRHKFKRYVKVFASDDNYDSLTPHTTRHTFASIANRYEVSEVALKKLMGHSIDDVTKGVYIHLSVDDLRSEIEKIKL